MPDSRSPFTLLPYIFCLGLLPSLSFAQLEPATSIVTGFVQKADYCTQYNGLRVLRLTIGFEIENMGTTALVLPRISRLTATNLTKPEGSAYRSEYMLTQADSAPENLYEAPGTNPQFFDILQPRDRRLHTSHTQIYPLSSASSKPKRGTISPGEYTIHMTLNLGPQLPGDKVVDQGKWASVGRLVLGEVKVEPLAMIVNELGAETCIGPPTLLSRSWLARWFRRVFR